MRAPRPLPRNAAPFAKPSRGRLSPVCGDVMGRSTTRRASSASSASSASAKPQGKPRQAGSSKHQRMGVAWRRNMGELGGLEGWAGRHRPGGNVPSCLTHARPLSRAAPSVWGLESRAAHQGQTDRDRRAGGQADRA
ncbi:hypothetical protein G7Z17_g6379 [Cylindrodendrum hubeiense]|uniref:Uncharacterized protein n=1 Tax=Cylindrodendrum hubeiense TaxID=595255 RepID=A0A9P5H5G2_9HYPO|nr:hypothetical protein G7Z17_g6379 [Cylindrodendrum hubeiense]